MRTEHISKVQITTFLDSSLNLFLSHLSPIHLPELDLLSLNLLYISKSLGDLTIQLCAAVKVNSTGPLQTNALHTVGPVLFVRI